MRNFLIIFIFFVLGINQNVYSQCSIVVDTANITHIACPNGGAVGAAQITQAPYLNFSWENITNGQLYNGGGGVGGTSRTDLDAGFYVIMGSWPYSSSCPTLIYSDTFEIKMPIINIQPNPNQACPSPNQCNVSTSISLTNTVAINSYSWKVDNLPQNTISYSFSNLCGGSHTYEILANSQSCGTENFGISQLAPINLSTSVTNVTCNQSGSATVNITGGGASALNNYCLSSPQQSIISTITNVSLIGDNNSITNNTSGICNLYSDFTAQLADVTPGNSYTLDLDLGSCISSFYIDIANIFVDWNIDGDFNDVNENIATIPPTQSPSIHTINFTVPANAVPGQSRMRIVMQNYSSQTSNQAGPCSNNTAVFGETEDYTILVAGSVSPPVTYLWSDGQTTQTAINLLAGTYNITITDAIGCSETETVVIGDLTNLSVTASGSQTICNGGIPNPLSATSSSSGTYSWSPASAFVDPNVQNPVFASGLTSSTTYTCTFTSGSCTDTDVVLITVNPIPTVTLSAVPNPACEGDDIVLTAVASTGFPYEYKFMYNDGTGWSGNNVTTPAWDINNSVIYSNITQSTQFQVRVREYNGCPPSNSPIVPVTVNWLPTQTIAISDSVCLGGVVPDLLAWGSLPTWYSDAALTTQVYQGSWYATGQTAVGLYTYYVTETLLL
jgi:hypothetical protein